MDRRVKYTKKIIKDTFLSLLKEKEISKISDSLHISLTVIYSKDFSSRRDISALSIFLAVLKYLLSDLFKANQSFSFYFSSLISRASSTIS